MPAHRDHEGRDFLLHYWRIVNSHKCAMLGMFAIGVVGAAVIAYRMTPIYRAVALVLVEDGTPRMVGIQGVYADDTAQAMYCKTQCEQWPSPLIFSVDPHFL